MIIFQVPAGAPEHNSLAVKIGTWLEQKISPEYAILYDTYTYIPHSVLEKLGHFKNGDPHEYMQTRLIEFGASAAFVAETVAWLVKQGLMPSSYAPDVCVIYESEYHNSFRVPIWIGEIVSKDSRDFDLYFKAYFYEQLGVKEYFVFETARRSGSLLQAYRLVADTNQVTRYENIPFDRSVKSLYSDVLKVEFPVEWKV